MYSYRNWMVIARCRLWVRWPGVLVSFVHESRLWRPTAASWLLSDLYLRVASTALALRHLHRVISGRHRHHVAWRHTPEVCSRVVSSGWWGVILCYNAGARVLPFRSAVLCSLCQPLHQHSRSFSVWIEGIRGFDPSVTASDHPFFAVLMVRGSEMTLSIKWYSDPPFTLTASISK